MDAARVDATRIIESGEWQFEDNVMDYRAEWPGNMLVERATWGPNTPTMMTVKLQGAEPSIVAAPNYIWFRFWLPEEDQVVERYFTPHGKPVGSYLPITMDLQKHDREYQSVRLILGLWIAADGRVTVLNETDFDEAVASGDVNPVESERAELRIRSLTSAVAQKRFPPALVRNFTIMIGSENEAGDGSGDGSENKPDNIANISKPIDDEQLNQ